MRFLAVPLFCLALAALLPAQLPTLVETTTPIYSDEALRAELEGIVMVSALVGTDGYAHDMRIGRSLGLGLDEKAIEAVRMWRLNPAVASAAAAPTPANIPVPFVLPSKSSRWHLVRVNLETPENGERANFLSTSYPEGAGISAGAYEQASIVHAIGRHGMATISFGIDARGVPENFAVEEQSDKVWGGEAIEVLKPWRFTPAMKNGAAVESRGTVTLAWGRRQWDAMTLNSLTTQPKPEALTAAALTGEYSEEGARNRIEGVVEVSFVLDDQGKPQNARVVRGLGYGLDEKALEAISKISLRFNGESPKVDGVTQTLGVRFRLAQVETTQRR
ncbi:MAG: TonB family protein [Acidobacteriota bacterium]